MCNSYENALLRSPVVVSTVDWWPSLLSLWIHRGFASHRVNWEEVSKQIKLVGCGSTLTIGFALRTLHWSFLKICYRPRLFLLHPLPCLSPSKMWDLHCCLRNLLSFSCSSPGNKSLACMSKTILALASWLIQIHTNDKLYCKMFCLHLPTYYTQTHESI